jgi:hypothetical protein
MGMIIVVSLVVIHQLNFSRTPLYEIPKLLSASRAKEYCTCYFIFKKEDKHCLEKVLKDYPLFKYKLEENRVTFSNPIATSTAYVRKNRRLGCILK